MDRFRNSIGIEHVLDSYLDVVGAHEVVAGVGGETAIRVGESIEALGGYHQVLSVTHLAQVAARSTHHLFLSKETNAGRTRSRCERLEGESRVGEIARLLSGESQKKETLDLAKSLLNIR